MPRRTIPSYRKRDKLFNKLDPFTRAEAQLSDFLAQKAKEKKTTRGELISSVMLNAARRAGYSGKNGQDLPSFLNDMAIGAGPEPKLIRAELIERTLTAWAKRNGYKPQE